MFTNPFTSNSTGTSSKTNTQSVHVNQAMSGSEKAEVIKSLAGDMSARLHRIQYLNNRLQQVNDDLGDSSQISGSRIDQLAKQLNSDF